MTKKINGMVFIIAALLVTLCLNSQAAFAGAETPEEALWMLGKGNKAYLAGAYGDISAERRVNTAESGQKPYAVVITCSDSRVPAEHIFAAGIGDLFVVRTAGNVVGKFELGSVEYGVESLGAKVVVIMGHSGCGAVSAAVKGRATGNVEEILEEIRAAIGGEKDITKAEALNIKHTKEKVSDSPVVERFLKNGDIYVLEAKYDINSGEVTFGRIQKTTRDKSGW